ncbi:MAG TPA: hypothetical protein VFJ64_10750 [Solirubrobacterales bacterium]|nr:hypothetical protein [Solirubrobacterales bacterium]
MSRNLVIVVAFAGGVASGLLFAKWYARHQVEGGVSDLLTKLGVSRGAADNIAGAVGGAAVG